MAVTVVEEGMEVGSVEEEVSNGLINNRKEEAIKKRRKKKRSGTTVATTFQDLYTLTGQHLGEGSYGRVETCRNVYTNIEYAVKIIEKRPGLYCRPKVLKEIEIYHLCRGHQRIIQLVEYFEEDDYFYLVFEKISGGPLLSHIQARVCFTEAEASDIIGSLAEALLHLHKQGIAHRDIKPDNILCVNPDSPCPVKLCDFDLCSRASVDISTPRLLTPVGSVEYMAPEVVDTFLIDDYYDDEEEDWSYDKKCDLWSLGIIMYILLCGYVPFSGRCGADCGWEKGENCPSCQELLFDSIKEGRVEFHEKYWSGISAEAKDLISSLLVKDVSQRLDAYQVLDHPWILQGGGQHTDNTTNLATVHNLQRQTSLRDLEDFASRAMSVNRAVEEVACSAGRGAPTSSPTCGLIASAPVTVPGCGCEREAQLRVGFPTTTTTTTNRNNPNTLNPLGADLVKPWRRETWSFDLSPPSESACGLLQRRRRSKHLLEKNRFCSIDELELEAYDVDSFMKAI